MYRECILEHPTEAHADNIDSQLWRNCFHIPIDYYRRFFKGPRSAEQRWAFTEVNRIIDCGYAFFGHLLGSLVALGQGYGENEAALYSALSVISLPIPRRSSQIKPGLESICYRLLICCGDLARYRSQFNCAFQDDRQQLAWRIYEAARRLDPDQGHSCNQLAVVATLSSHHQLAVHWYLRAQCCLYPFAAARDNLMAYLQKMGTITTADLTNELIAYLLSIFKGDDVITYFDSFIKWLALGLGLETFSPKEVPLLIIMALAIIKIHEQHLQNTHLDSLAEAFIDVKHEDYAITIILLMTILRYILSDTLRRKILKFIVENGNSVVFDTTTKTKFDMLTGFTIFEPLNFAQIQSSVPLSVALFNAGLSIVGMRVRDGQLCLAESIISTPQGASSPLVLFAPPSSDPQHAQTHSYHEDEDEIVIFQGIAPCNNNDNDRPPLYQEDIDSSPF